MVKFSITGAALAALLSFGSVIAQEGVPQQPTVAARIAEAKLKEARGELAAAETVLRQALAQATGDEQQQVKQQLAALLERQGKAREAAQLLGVVMTETVDPLDEEVMMLDRDLMSETVDCVKTELGKLGPLAVPALLKALPKFGPYGLSNALEVLAGQDDPRIAPALAKVAENKDPSVALAFAQNLGKLQRAVALPLARRFADPKQPPVVQLEALWVLLNYEVDQPATRALALRLAGAPDLKVQESLLSLGSDSRIAFRGEVLDLLRRQGAPELRVSATSLWLLSQADLDEAQALAALRELPESGRWKTARDLVKDHPAWVHVALQALLGRGELDENDGVGSQFVKQVEWWRAPDESARAMAQVKVRNGIYARYILGALRELAGRGWQAPPELDGALTNLSVTLGQEWSYLVDILPADAEARALMIWRTLSPDDKLALVLAAVRAARPWHHLVVEQLRLATAADKVRSELIRRDWTAVAPEDAAVLVDLAHRWPARPAGGLLDWQILLATACQQFQDLPVAAALPFAVHVKQAFHAAANRDPAALLAWLRDQDLPLVVPIDELARLLQQHGTHADVPVALRALEWLAKSRGAPMPSDLSDFFWRRCGGDVDVIRLGLRSTSRGYNIATEAARQARVDDIEALLALLPDLQQDCSGALIGALANQVAPGHATLLLRAADTLLTTVVGDDDQQLRRRESALGQVLSLLRHCEGPAVLDLCKRVLSTPDCWEQTKRTAAITAVSIAGVDQRAVLVELLASGQPVVVEVAVIAEVLRDVPELQQLRREAVLRLADRLHNAPDVFRSFDPEGQAALAETLLASPLLSSFKEGICRAAVDTLGRLKDPARIPQLAAAARHPNLLVRVSAANALGLTFSREAAVPLIEMLKDESKDVREAAQKALDQIANYLDAKAKWEERLK